MLLLLSVKIQHEAPPTLSKLFLLWCTRFKQRTIPYSDSESCGKDCAGLLQVATAVAEEAFRLGVARIKKPVDLRGFIEYRMWDPEKPHLNASTPLTTPRTTPKGTPRATADVDFPKHKPLA